MNSPTRFEAPPACIRRSQRLLLSTKAVEAIADPVSTFEAAVTSLENRYDAWKQARQQARVAMRAQHEAEDILDRELRGVALAILTVDQGRRKSEVYRRYFPDGYGAVLHLHASNSMPIAAGLLAAMESETIPDILSRRDPLTAARTALEAVVNARLAAEGAAGQAKALLEEEKLAWRKALNTFYFAVRTIFSDQRGYVESLFHVNGSQQPADEPALPAAATAEPAGGTEPAVTAAATAAAA